MSLPLLYDSGKYLLLAVFFPLMKLDSTYTLRYGKIGPINMLKDEYPLLNNLLPVITRNMVNNQPIENPIVAVCSDCPDKLMEEIECITFFPASSMESRAEEEILGPRHILQLYEKENQIFCNLNGEATALLELFSGFKFQYFPQAYYIWDGSTVGEFETFLSEILNSNFYSALALCISDVEDKEEKRDRRRILVSIKIFNEAFIPPNITSIQLFSKSYLILIGAAFEALMNLPGENIGKAFQHSVMLLAGNRSGMLKRWCKEFYEIRSKLAHGDIEWYKDEDEFNFNGHKRISFKVIARDLFVHCLKTKLFLMGIFPKYERDIFCIESYERWPVGFSKT